MPEHSTKNLVSGRRWRSDRQVHDQHALLGRRQRAQHFSGRQVQDARRAAEDAVALPEAKARQGLPSDAVRVTVPERFVGGITGRATSLEAR